MIKNRSTVLCLLACSTATTPIIASEINPVIVTASRTAQTVDESLAPVTVMVRDDIEQANAKDLPELLRRIPGADFSSSGGYGKNSSLFLRGTNSDHVLVLIDGMRHGSATLGSASLQHIPLAQIERIEVVRGPRAALYGADAIGGVVQIFTRDSSEAFNVSAKAGYGTYNTSTVEAGVSGTHGRGDGATGYRFNVARFDTDGIDAEDETDSENDKDGYDNTSVTAAVDHRFSTGNSADLRFMRAQGSTEFDGSFQNKTDYVQQALSAGLQLAPGTDWNMQFKLGETRDQTENFHDSVYSSEFNTRRLFFSWQNDITLGAMSLLTLGVDHADDRVDSSTDYAESSRDNSALFTQWQDRAGEHDILVALRHDDNEAFGRNTTGNIEWGYDVADALRVTAAYGTAFKAPSFNDLYYPGFGNPNLNAEESESWELGLSGDTGTTTQWELRAYRTRVDNLIEWVDTGGFVFEPQNVDEAEIDGLEAAIATELAGWHIRGSASVVDPRNAETGHRLRRRSPRTLTLDADRTRGAWTFSLGLLAQDARYEDADNQTRLSGYGLLDLKIAYALGRGWSADLEIDNALDKDYQTAEGYSRLDRTLMFNLSYHTAH